MGLSLVQQGFSSFFRHIFDDCTNFCSTLALFNLPLKKPHFSIVLPKPETRILGTRFITNYIPANTTMGAPRATETDLGKVLNTSLMSLTPGQVMNKEQEVKVSP